LKPVFDRSPIDIAATVLCRGQDLYAVTIHSEEAVKCVFKRALSLLHPAKSTSVMAATVFQRLLDGHESFKTQTPSVR
jgi:hypothetical protein